jgi:hypothetical protein
MQYLGVRGKFIRFKFIRSMVAIRFQNSKLYTLIFFPISYTLKPYSLYFNNLFHKTYNLKPYILHLKILHLTPQKK